MGMFAMRKPRGFNHSYIYVDERKEKLAKMEENAKRDLGMLPEKEFSPEDIRGKFIEGTTHLKRRKESGRKPMHLGDRGATPRSWLRRAGATNFSIGTM